jgi:serine/threonine protein phosphatase PrpC
VKIQVEVAAKTDIGLKRKNNEDNFGFDTRLGVFVLCDGMGGQAAGEVASRLAVQCVLDYFRESDKLGYFPSLPTATPGLSQRSNSVLAAIELANKAIWDAGLHNVRQTGMGSTIVVAKFNVNTLTVGHVGDSRAYLLRDGKLKQLTLDHSLVMEQLRRGFITPEEASRSALQNVIIRALGSTETVEVDVQELEVRQGDMLLLTCDGLTKVVSDDQIKSILVAEENLETAAAHLLNAAKQNQSDDNVTCVVIRFIRRSWFRLSNPQQDKTEGPV